MQTFCIRHRWTGRYEAHLWDKNSWNETQSKKGRQGQQSIRTHNTRMYFDETKIRRFDMFTPIYPEDLARRYCS